MYEASPTTIVAALGLLLGAIAGATARSAEFCTLGAIADAYLMGDLRRMRAWLLAIAMAILALAMLAAATMQFSSVRNNTRGNIVTQATGDRVAVVL